MIAMTHCIVIYTEYSLNTVCNSYQLIPQNKLNLEIIIKIYQIILFIKKIQNKKAN